MKATKRLIANILEIVVGVILTILGYTGVVDSYWSGMGTALIFVGVIFLFRTLPQDEHLPIFGVQAKCLGLQIALLPQPCHPYKVAEPSEL